MHQRVAGRGNAVSLPDRTRTADLLRNCCGVLPSSCPEAETLVIGDMDRL